MFILFRHIFSSYLLFALVRFVFQTLSTILPQWVSVVAMLIALQWFAAEAIGMRSIVEIAIALVNGVL